jgi:hypothetical protein
MPTPAPNAPERTLSPPSSASCPDPDVDPVQDPRSPPSWRPAQRQIDTQESSMLDDHPMNDAATESTAPSRSETMSPRPASSSNGTARETDLGQDNLTPATENTDEVRKSADRDEEMGSTVIASADVSQSRNEMSRSNQPSTAAADGPASRYSRRLETETSDDLSILDPPGYPDVALSTVGYGMRVRDPVDSSCNKRCMPSQE